VKSGIIACCLIAVAWAALAVVQLWFAPLAAAVFVKISITAGLLFVVVLVISLVVREYLSEKKMKKSGHIDG
jgi:hypothetical protein